MAQCSPPPNTSPVRSTFSTTNMTMHYLMTALDIANENNTPVQTRLRVGLASKSLAQH